FELAERLQQSILPPRGLGQIALHALKAQARAAALPPPAGEISILNILDLAQDRLARKPALAAPGLSGERSKALLYIRRKTKDKHSEAPDAISVNNEAMRATGLNNCAPAESRAAGLRGPLWQERALARQGPATFPAAAGRVG